MRENGTLPWELLRAHLDAVDRESAESLLAALPPDQTIRVLFRLNTDDQERLLSLVSPDYAAELLDDIPEAHAADLIENLGVEQAAHIVDELPSDEGADLLGSMTKDDADAILDEMDPVVAGQVRELISYSPDVAGGLMEPESCAYDERIRVEDFLTDIDRRRGEIEQLPSRLILLDRAGRPVGGVEMRDVMLAQHHALLRPKASEILTVPANATLDDL